jgi:ankyrin repeat protein
MAHADDLLAAIAAGDAERVRGLVAADPALAEARDAQGTSAVLLAHYHRQPAVRDALLAAGPALDVGELAAVGDAAALEARLAAAPAEAHARSADGFTPLHYAAFFGGAAAVRALLAAGADPDARAENPTGVRPLHSAAAVGDHAAVGLLLAAGVPVDPRQQGGFTPLHTAAHNDDVELARTLLDHGADPGLAAEDGRDAGAMAGPRVAALLRERP